MPRCFDEVFVASSGGDRERRFWQASLHPETIETEAFYLQELDYLPANVRSANRNRNAPANRNTNNGFRPSSTWQQDANPVPPEFESGLLSRSAQPSPGRRPVPGDLGYPDERSPSPAGLVGLRNRTPRRAHVIEGEDPSSRQQVHEHISKGYRQITRQNLDGVVCIGLELMVAKELEVPERLDFRRGYTPPFVIMENRLNTELHNLQAERERDYPCERKLDGLMLTGPGGLSRCPADSPARFPEQTPTFPDPASKSHDSPISHQSRRILAEAAK